MIFSSHWRRVRDLNPRSAHHRHEISSFAPSTTRTTLRIKFLCGVALVMSICGLRKNLRLWLCFFDHCTTSASLHPPPTAPGFCAIPSYLLYTAPRQLSLCRNTLIIIHYFFSFVNLPLCRYFVIFGIFAE